MLDTSAGSWHSSALTFQRQANYGVCLCLQFLFLWVVTSSYLTSSLPLLRLFPHHCTKPRENKNTKKGWSKAQRASVWCIWSIWGGLGLQDLWQDIAEAKLEYMTRYQWHQCGSITVGTVIWSHMQLWRKRRLHWAGQQELEPAHREVSWAGKSQSCTWVGRTGKVGESG